MKIRTLKLLADGERVERGCMSRWVTQIGQNLWLGEIGRQVQIIQICTKRYRICTAFGTEDGGWWGQGWYEDTKTRRGPIFYPHVLLMLATSSI